MTLEKLQADWVDSPEYHQHIKDLFTGLVDLDMELKAHRDFVETNIFGFGERCFWYLWKILLENLPENAKMLEIGVFRAATISLWRILKPNADISGITPLNTAGGVWESDYAADIKRIHDEFSLKQPNIIIGYSNNGAVIDKAWENKPYDVVYIDGGHEREDIDNDLKYYARIVKQGGYLVIDDACCDMHMPFGFFQGIQPVTDGLLYYLSFYGGEWEFIGNVVHLRVYKRK